MEITREIVEHYARALGLGETPYCIGPVSGLSWLWRHHPGGDVGRNEIAFRLGLCAAAERNLGEAIALAAMPCAPALHRVGNELLRAAGIDPETWEKARSS